MPGIENSTNKLIKQKSLCRYSFHWDDVFILLNCQKILLNISCQNHCGSVRIEKKPKTLKNVVNSF